MKFKCVLMLEMLNRRLHVYEGEMKLNQQPALSFLCELLYIKKNVKIFNTYDV